MKVFLEYLALCTLLQAGPKARGSALRDQSHILKSAKLEIENLLYDAIFNSSALDSLQHGNHGTSNISVDSRTQECLDIYTWRNFELLHVSGMKMRRCMRVSEMDLEKYFNIHRNEVVDLKRGVMEQVTRCTRNRSAFRMLDCYVDVIMAALNLVKSSDDFWRQKSCLRTELYGLIQKLDDESDRMMNCFQNLTSIQSSSSGNGQLVFKQPHSSTVQANSVNNSSLTTSLGSSVPSSAFNSSRLSPNKTNVLETQKPLNDSINQNATSSLRPTQPLQNTTNNSRSLTRLNSTLHKINKSNLGTEIPVNNKKKPSWWSSMWKKFLYKRNSYRDLGAILCIVSMLLFITRLL